MYLNKSSQNRRSFKTENTWKDMIFPNVYKLLWQEKVFISLQTLMIDFVIKRECLIRR